MVVSTACSGSESSFSTSNYLYDEFVYHWTAAVNGKYPNGSVAQADINSDNKISMKEAFDYGCSNDAQKETPQFYDGKEIVAKSSKPVSCSTTYFYGTYTQETCTYYSAAHPAISTTVLSPSKAMFVHQGCMVHIKSNMLPNREVKHSGINPEVFFYDGKDQMVFSLPLGSGGIPFHILITGDGDCLSTDLLFFTVSYNGNIKTTKSLKIVKSGKESAMVNVMSQDLENVENTGVSNQKSEYDIQVYSGINGDRLLHDTFSGNSYQVNTSNWKKGLYVIRVSLGDTVLTSKLTL